MPDPAIEPLSISHRPDYPFGCGTQWGPLISPRFPDHREHICNRDEGHGGRHRCACGATHA